jgi:hypothetical protein
MISWNKRALALNLLKLKRTKDWVLDCLQTICLDNLEFKIEELPNNLKETPLILTAVIHLPALRKMI